MAIRIVDEIMQEKQLMQDYKNFNFDKINASIAKHARILNPKKGNLSPRCQQILLRRMNETLLNKPARPDELKIRSIYFNYQQNYLKCSQQTKLLDINESRKNDESVLKQFLNQSILDQEIDDLFYTKADTISFINELIKFYKRQLEENYSHQNQYRTDNLIQELLDYKARIVKGGLKSSAASPVARRRSTKNKTLIRQAAVVRRGAPEKRRAEIGQSPHPSNASDSEAQLLHYQSIENFTDYMRKQNQEKLRLRRQDSSTFYGSLHSLRVPANPYPSSDRVGKIEKGRSQSLQQLESFQQQTRGILQQCDVAEESSRVMHKEFKRFQDDLDKIINQYMEQLFATSEAISTLNDNNVIKQSELLHQYLKKQIQISLHENKGKSALPQLLKKYVTKYQLSTQIQNPLYFNDLLHKQKRELLKRQQTYLRCYLLKQFREISKYVNLGEYYEYK